MVECLREMTGLRATAASLSYGHVAILLKIMECAVRVQSSDPRSASWFVGVYFRPWYLSSAAFVSLTPTTRLPFRDRSDPRLLLLAQSLYFF
jgi:hypothetical protein